MSTAFTLTHPAKPYVPTVYDVSFLRDGVAIVEVSHGGFGRSVVERGFDCAAAAEHRIDELLDLEAEEAAEAQAAANEYAKAAYEDEMDRLYMLVNSQGGYVAPEDIAGQARSRAIDAVLAAIDGLSIKKAA